MRCIFTRGNNNLDILWHHFRVCLVNQCYKDQIFLQKEIELYIAYFHRCEQRESTNFSGAACMMLSNTEAAYKLFPSQVPAHFEQAYGDATAWCIALYKSTGMQDRWSLVAPDGFSRQTDFRGCGRSKHGSWQLRPHSVRLLSVAPQWWQRRRGFNPGLQIVLCLHFSAVCKACSACLHMDQTRPFQGCSPGSHSQHCNSQYLCHALGQWAQESRRA